MSRRIPPAEATEYPWWAIVDPGRAALPDPADIDGGSCRDCGARGDEPCLQTEEEDQPGAQRDERHDGHSDYRDTVEAGDLVSVVTGPFLSRKSAERYLERRRYAFSDRAQVWCLSGHESADWRGLCMQPGDT